MTGRKSRTTDDLLRASQGGDAVPKAKAQPAPKAKAQPAPRPKAQPRHRSEVVSGSGRRRAERSPARPAEAAVADPLAREIERAQRNPANRLEECVILSTIEQSAVGAMHRAWDLQEKRLVAVRVVDGVAELNLDVARRLREMSTNLIHPNIPRLRRFGVTDDREFYLVTDLVRGRSLSSYRHKPKRVVLAIRDVAKALDYANANGFIHGSILPQSVIIDDEGLGHLIDFGLYLAVSTAVAAGSLSLPRLSGRYRAPECLEASSLGGARSEVYSLGASFYFGLARQPPGTGEVIPPRRLRGGVPKPIQAICLKCLSHSPADRYPSAAGVASDLDDFLRTRKPS